MLFAATKNQEVEPFPDPSGHFETPVDHFGFMRYQFSKNLFGNH